MVLLTISIILFNFIAYKKNKIPTMNRKVSLWTFTIAFQISFDVIIEFKYGGYWYFDKGVDWFGVFAHTILIPPINILFISYFPFNHSIIKKVLYITYWTVGITMYEALTLLPEPLGYFHLGWWKLWFEFIIVPILLLMILGYYKWISKLEMIALDINKRSNK
ncbi:MULTISPECIES: hypothetical protein [Niallia]|jgi:hypothetical protein|uniref:hypothetical protein n=1 Tax=Niallia TaxID=2837506 RepID=UPI0030F76AA4